MNPASQNSDAWPEEGVEEVHSCPVCGGETHHKLHSGLMDRIFYCAPGEWTLTQCMLCRSAYLDPRPTLESIPLAYKTYYTHVASDENESQSDRTVARFRRSLLNGYLNWRFGANFIPENRWGIFCAWLYPGLRNTLDRRYRNLPKVQPGSSLLDVGFGNGRFLAYAENLGWKVMGADPDPVTIKAARGKGFDVRQGGIESFDDMANFFDVITLNHVIEHIHDPRLLLKKAYRLLKPGGSLWLETPNIDSFGHRHFGSHWRGLEPPRHLVLFNWNSLETLLTKEGFCLKRSFPSTSAFAGLAAKSRAIEAGADPYQARITLLDRLFGLMAKLFTLFDRRYSEHVTVLAVKPRIEGGG